MDGTDHLLLTGRNQIELLGTRWFILPKIPPHSTASCKEKAVLLNLAKKFWLLQVGMNSREDWTNLREEIYLVL